MKKDNLPPLVEDFLGEVPTEQRHLALLSSLTLCPVFFDKAYYLDSRGKHGLGLGTVILMPPASGKGIIAQLVRIAEPLNIDFRQRNKAIAKPNKGMLSFGDRRHLIAGGDITAPKLVEVLSDNNGLPMLLADTEVDSLIVSAKGEHGGKLSSILRKALEQELLTMERRKNAEELYVAKPWIAVLLSGTLDQFHGLLRGNTDGLHSRLLFYRSEGTTEWMDTVPGQKGNTLEDRYKAIGQRMKALHETYRDVDIEVTFKDDHWVQRNKLGTQWLVSFRELGPNALGIPKRAANNLMKLAGSLTLARNCESIPAGSKVTWQCTDEDFATARKVVEASLACSREIFVELTKSVMTPSEKRNLDLLSLLGPSFKTAEAVTAGQSIGLPVITTKRMLKKLLSEERLVKERHGHHTKVLADWSGVDEEAEGKFVSKDQNIS